MRVDTLIMGNPIPSPWNLEKPFRPLEPLNLWIYGDLETLHPLDPEGFGFWKRQALERLG